MYERNLAKLIEMKNKFENTRKSSVFRVLCRDIGVPGLVGGLNSGGNSAYTCCLLGCCSATSVRGVAAIFDTGAR